MKLLAQVSLTHAAPRAAVPLLCVVLLASGPRLAQAQETEPVLEQLREVFGQPGLTLGFLLQAVADPGLDGENASARVANARLIASGTLDGGFSYLLQTNFAASPSLLDARVRWSPDARFAVSAGRFKAPFSQELLTFAGDLDFVDRSRVVNALAPNRQYGVELSGALSEHISWSFGGFTSSSNQTPNESLAGVGRVRGSGIELGDGTLSVAGHVAVGRDGAIGAGANGVGFRGDGTLLGIEGRYVAGRLLLAGELVRADWDPMGAPETDADGLYLTGGWMVRPNHQALVRWDRYRSPTGVGDDALVLGYTAWPSGAAKIQTNLLVPIEDNGQSTTLLVNFQIGF